MKYSRNLSMYLIIFAFIILLVIGWRMTGDISEVEEYSYSDMLQDLEEGNVVKISVERDADVSDAGIAQVTLKPDASDTEEIDEDTIGATKKGLDGKEEETELSKEEKKEAEKAEKEAEAAKKKEEAKAKKEAKEGKLTDSKTYQISVGEEEEKDGQVTYDVTVDERQIEIVDEEVDIEDEAKIGDTKKGKTHEVEVVGLSSFMQYVNDYALDGGDADLVLPPKTGIFLSLLSPLIFFVITVIIMMFLIQRMQGGGGAGKMSNFGKSKAKVTVEGKDKVTFDDVAGLDEEKEELEEIVEFLKAPRKFMDIGARIPKGVLMVGPPGTGKTYLARAVSGEAGVPFFSISGSDFVEMFVGVGASRVRDLFEEAKKNSPCIIFIDEIDAVGRRRGAGLGGGHDEREQTLNQLLVEMDGFGENEGVIVIAATNRVDILDPAILRPGRFDRRVTVNPPDVRGREGVLEVHSKDKKMGTDVDFEVVARTTPGFTPADLENLLNEAALLSARDGKKEITMEYIRKAFIKVGIGAEKKSKVVSEKARKITAYHEAGHAIIYEVLSELDPVHIVSIIPTGPAGGYTMSLPGEDQSYMMKREMEQQLVAMLGGRAAEELVLDDISTGASNDIERATALARSMVTKYGMSEELGPIQYGGGDSGEVFLGKDLGSSKDYGEDIAKQIDVVVSNMLQNAYKESKELLNEYMDVLHDSAELLLEKEKITGTEFRDLFGDDLPKKSEPRKKEFMGLTDEEIRESEARISGKSSKKKDKPKESTKEDDDDDDDNDNHGGHTEDTQPQEVEYDEGLETTREEGPLVDTIDEEDSTKEKPDSQKE